ncbi:MAG: NADH-quinone oxidoreductase subunit M [Chloroflexi bacterium]|nr:NADH-quinone oxidoreductase subunit M [Chloroflexota bacterium]
MAIPRDKTTVAKWAAAIAAFVTIVLTTYMFVNYDYQKGGFQFVEQYPWISSLGVSVKLGIDGISAPLMLLTAIVIFCGVFASWYVKDRPQEFLFFLFVLVAGVFGVFGSIDTLVFFFFYELAVIPMYPLIAIWGSTRKEYGAMKLTLYLVAGSVLIWTALLAVYVASGTNSFDLEVLQKVTYEPWVQTVFFAFFMVGFGVLGGLWPFHTWSPGGHAAAPTAVSMLHAGVLMKLGAYGIIRLGMVLLPEGAKFWLPVLIAIATINVVYGAISALAQKDFKYLIGYSSVSHCGYVLMGIGTLTVIGLNGAVLQMFSHGIMTALFFLLVGSVYDSAHTRDLNDFGGLAKVAPVIAIFFALAGLAGVGLPGLSGFVAEFMVLVGTFQTYPILGILGIIAVAITAVYVLRMLAKVFFGPLNTRWVKLPDARRAEVFAMSILGFFLVLVGVYPTHFVRVITSGVAPIVTRIVGAQ